MFEYFICLSVIEFQAHISIVIINHFAIVRDSIYRVTKNYQHCNLTFDGIIAKFIMYRKKVIIIIPLPLVINSSPHLLSLTGGKARAKTHLAAWHGTVLLAT